MLRAWHPACSACTKTLNLDLFRSLLPGAESMRWRVAILLEQIIYLMLTLHLSHRAREHELFPLPLYGQVSTRGLDEHG